MRTVEISEEKETETFINDAFTFDQTKGFEKYLYFNKVDSYLTDDKSKSQEEDDAEDR